MNATNVRVSAQLDGEWVDVISRPPLTFGRVSMRHNSFSPSSVSVRFDLDPQVKAVLDRVNSYTDDRFLEWRAYTAAVIHAAGPGFDVLLMSKSLGVKIEALMAIDTAFVNGRPADEVAAEIVAGFRPER